MRFLLIFCVFATLFGCTTTYNTKINSDNVIFVEKTRPVVLIHDLNNPYKDFKK